MLSAKGMPSDLPPGLDPLERNRRSFAAGSLDGTPRLPRSGSTAGGAPPGNAGVSPASLFLAGGDGASAQRCRQAATLPACTALASQNERQGPVTVRSQWRSRPRLCRANVRAGRPRSRVGIIHTTNREHDLHHAHESGKAPFASLKYHPRERGRLARNLIPRWRRWSLCATLPAGSHPAGVTGIGQSE